MASMCKVTARQARLGQKNARPIMGRASDVTEICPDRRLPHNELV